MGKIDFIAVDFETANYRLENACSIGIAVVEELEVVQCVSSLLHPMDMNFSGHNIKVHGITPEQVESAPTFAELWLEIRKYFRSDIPIVAHNAHFDMSVLKLQEGFRETPGMVYVDTISMAGEVMTGSKTLDACAEALGITLEHHHDACDDAVAAAEIAIHVIEKADCGSMWEYLARCDRPMYKYLVKLKPQLTMGRGRKSNGSFASSSIKISELKPSVPCTNTTSELCGKNIVFTGDMSISREQAMQMAIDVGAIVKSSVSRKTDYLVVGKQDKALVGDDGLSTKEEKAYELNDSGAGHIQILSEEEFRDLLKCEVLV